ncbi:D-alanyl-D-alanine carboxypeptidase (penicillin-binding protein 5/6) [Frateuria terrea]|uniref:D-alanyl-D-alanine carboxypeptidase (Penicillin-binding protein 5/6) n=1 Tax=Frateuria terrea TaxID=529704 RepID=A0A1H6Z6M6_9GAMM|nr:D-alanyl-D-alanine carboxypeptidase (penicillin-binding protein 5/6) [Frateuria terrea]SFP77185.1 D-alanyl-D-alanine carboxypeptidase (penicillin-binding protein 5/6) [Frateuria terrea]
MTSSSAAGNTGVSPESFSSSRLGALLAITLLWLVASVAHAGQAAIVVDATTGRVLGQVNADEQNYPASLTKMMTLYLTFRELKAGRLTLEDNLPVSRWAADREPSKLGLRPGQTITVQDCILAMVTKSANDAATVAAESIGGTETGFADMMNAQAALLGMAGTHFDNASGLPDPRNVSTARDLLTLAMALYRDFPQYAHYFSTTQFTFEGRVVHGHNHLMDRYDGMDGLKTGYTAASGFNLASTAVRDGHRLFAVVLGGRTANKRDSLMASLLDAGFEQSEAAAALAAAGQPPTGVAHRVLAALSPIASAEADPAPASAPRRVKHRGAARRSGHRPHHHAAKQLADRKSKRTTSKGSDD